MLRTIYISLLLLSLGLCLNGQKVLSENSKISVLTCSQGDELYSAFGHSAIWVSDVDNNIDWVFNYGTFNFNTPNFYIKFANGKLNYMLSIGEYKRFFASYFRDNRSITEQILNLNIQDRQQVFNALMVNYRPENRNYKYDFFFDNCATRIYDIISENIDGHIILNTEEDSTKEVSFREYLHHYLAHSPWIETGLKLILGLPADNIATIKESTYLPHFLMNAFDQATIKKADGNLTTLVKETNNLLEFDNKSYKTFLTPVIVFWFILIIVVILSLILKNNSYSFLDRALFFVTGIIGLIVCYLWFITDHSVTGNNLNVLWALPTFLYLGFSNYKTKSSKFIMKFNLLVLVIFLIGWKFIPQSFPAATIPMALLLTFRTFVILKKQI